MRRTLLAATLLLSASVWKAPCIEIRLISPGGGAGAGPGAAQELRPSAFGGWVVNTWPFTMRVDDTALFAYQSGREQLLDQTRLELSGSDAALPELPEELRDGTEVAVADLSRFRFARPDVAKPDLAAGEHVIRPGELRFTVRADGTVASDDPRLRVLPDGALGVLCHPVVIRTVAGGRSVPAPLRLTCGAEDILAGLAAPVRDAEAEAAAAGGKAPGADAPPVLRATVYLPASVPELPYALNGVRFTLGGEGEVVVRDPEGMRLAGKNELQVVQESDQEARRRLLGFRWEGAPAGVRVVVGEGSVESIGASGSAGIEIPGSAGSAVLPVAIGPLKGAAAVTVRVPLEEAWPHKVLVASLVGRAVWLCESRQVLHAPGGEITCRITALTPGAARLPESLDARLTPVAAGGDAEPSATGTGLTLSRGGANTFAGEIPRELPAGAWELRARLPGIETEPGLALLAVRPPAATLTVTLHTARNRGVFRRGDPVDLFWITSGAPAGGGEWPVHLSGPGLEREVGRIRVPAAAGGGAASGHLRLDSSALAPGGYTATIGDPAALVYPARLRIVQREPASDFTLYSYVFGQVRPNGGLPGMTYYDSNLAGEPALRPVMDATRGGLDPAFAAFASAPSGPALGACLPAPDEEAATAALASLGSAVVPGMPRMIHHEEWNPKHTLPEELTRMRRRLALFTQGWADVAGFTGVALNWYATVGGYWEESPPLDGHQAARNAAADQAVAAGVEKCVEEARAGGADEARLAAVRRQANFELRSRILPDAYGAYLEDARAIRPDLTAHTGIPSFWLGGGHSYPPQAYASLTHRDTVDYTDYGISPWGNFRAPAFLDMGNPDRQPTRGCYMTYGRHSRVVTGFAVAGRGLDGLSLNPEDPYSGGEDGALLRVFERFGSYFRALEPMRDVAVYYSAITPWPQQKSVILHDLARLRRPGMLLSPEDVLAGRLAGHHVLFLAGVTADEPPAVFAAFAEFAKQGGVIVKDRTCAESVPGRDLGFAYDKDQLHSGWGLAYPNGEWEFAHLWTNYLEHREKPLEAALAGAPALPVGTPTHDVLISPLAGRESVCCFVVNQTYVPMSVEGKWRQHAVLPRPADLRVADGWHAYDLLRGRPCTLEKRDGAQALALDFTRLEGGVYLLTQRAPAGMAMRSERGGATLLRVTAWLADAQEKALPDPMPFEVTLRGADGGVLFRRYAASGPERPVEVPVPVQSGAAPLELVVRDLVLGHVATQAVAPAPVETVAAATTVDVIGAEAVRAFLSERKGVVSLLLDEGQDAYAPAAEALARRLREGGREARVLRLDPADLRLLPLRWEWQDADRRLVAAVGAGDAIAWRIDLPAFKKGREFSDPRFGFAEYGPRAWIEGDVVLFGSPRDHRLLADLAPWLRRQPTEDYPAPGDAFVHYLWSPFSGGFDGLYIGCRDAAGAAAAVESLANGPGGTPGQAASYAAAAPAVTKGAPGPAPEDLVAGHFGTRILDAAFSPSGQRLFVTADSYGDSFFVLDAEGRVASSRPFQNRCGNSLWWRRSGGLRAVDERTLYVSLWNAEYRYDVEKGFASRAVQPGHGLAGRFSVPVGGATSLSDPGAGRTYLGGARHLRALDRAGKQLWVYDDGAPHADTAFLLYPRSLFVRSLSPDGRRLLVSGFGIEHDCYSIGRVANPSVLGFDAESGRLLWERGGLVLNEGKVVAVPGGFVVFADTGETQVLDADTGESKTALRPVGGTDWVLAVPGRAAVLVVENGHFDAAGPTARVYLRPLGDAPDTRFALDGRVTDVALAPEGDAVFLASERGRTARFALDGACVWQATTPTGGLLRLSPDKATLLVGGRDGTLAFLDAADGRVIRTVDFNRYNLTTPERFVEQLSSIGDVPPDAAATIPPDPPAPSYLTSLAREAVSFGPNQLTGPMAARPDGGGGAASLAPLGQPAEFALQLEAGKTYLFECLVAADAPAGKARLEVALRHEKSDAAPFYAARLPLGTDPARRRLAFRPGKTGAAVLRLQGVEPAEGAAPAKSATVWELTTTPAIRLGELVCAAMDFTGPNLVRDEGVHARTSPKGSLSCEVKPWTGGNSTIRWQPYPAPKAALRMVDGILAGQETAWVTEATGPDVAYAEAVAEFKTPQPVTAVAVYEDPSGPVPAGSELRERAATHYGVYVRERRSGQWSRVGYVRDNASLVNVFTFPATDIDRVRYFWAGRNDADRTDGFVRAAEIEVYGTEEAGLLPTLDDEGDDFDLE